MGRVVVAEFIILDGVVRAPGDPSVFDHGGWAVDSRDQAVALLTALTSAGAHSIVFVPIGPDPDKQLNLFAKTVAPAVRGAT